MRIISLVDNVPGCCPGEHGLSLWIELKSGLKVLFDTGQGSLFAENAARLGLDLAAIDIAVISHGHYDHGGGLNTFLELNSKARVHLRPTFFEPHYSLKECGLKNISPAPVDPRHADRLVFSGDPCEGLTLFSSVCSDFPAPAGNSNLFGSDGVTPDDFCHEQNLIIRENGKTFLFAGCAHRGAANIITDALKIAGNGIDYFIGGMHLMRTEEGFDSLAETLSSFEGCRYLTMHCTGEDSYRRLKEKMGDSICYLACGASVTL